MEKMNVPIPENGTAIRPKACRPLKTVRCSPTGTRVSFQTLVSIPPTQWPALHACRGWYGGYC